MFLNKPVSAKSILAINENSSSLNRSKSLGANATKKASLNVNVAKTPHRNKDTAASKGGRTIQRRRRALGDISNRKAVGWGGGSGKVGVVSKQLPSNIATQGSSKSGNSKASFPSFSAKHRTVQVKFSQTPSTKDPLNKVRLEGSGMKTANRVPSSSSTEYDGVFGVTTRWSSFSFEDEGRSSFDLVQKEELDRVGKIHEDRWERREKEREERYRLEDERNEQHSAETILVMEGANRKDIADFSVSDKGGDIDRADDWDLLKKKLPWEEEDSVYDPAEERRLSGTDPSSLWGNDV